jgi:hypothetical protein
LRADHGQRPGRRLHLRIGQPDMPHPSGKPVRWHAIHLAQAAVDYFRELPRRL